MDLGWFNDEFGHSDADAVPSFTGLAAELNEGSARIMLAKAHGTCERGPMVNLRWACDGALADQICCFNRHGAEDSGYWETTSFLAEEGKKEKEVTFYDSVSGKALFVAPRGRTWREFLDESKAHGWPSFRDEEVVKEHVRVLNDGEAVSVAGTHLGHNLPDDSGNRYCINLVSVAGRAVEGESGGSGGGGSSSNNSARSIGDHINDSNPWPTPTGAAPAGGHAGERAVTTRRHTRSR